MIVRKTFDSYDAAMVKVMIIRRVKIMTKSMITMGNINMPALIQIGQIQQSWSCERENTESENNMIF